MIIELSGLPASGKSVFAQRISESCRLSVVKPEGRLELIALNILFFVRFPLYSIKTLYYIFTDSHNFRTTYLKLMNTYLHHNAKYMKAKMRGEGIIDEGHLQNIFSLFDEIQKKDRIKRYMRSIPRSDMYLLIIPTDEERNERVEKRGYVGREGMFDSAERERWNEAMKSHQVFILEERSNLGEVVIIRSTHDEDAFITQFCS